MEKTIQKEFKLSWQVRLTLALGFFIFFIISVFVYGKLYKQIGISVREQAVASISNISELNASSVNRSIENRQSLMKILAKRAEAKRLERMDVLLMEIETFLEPYEFYSMGVLTREEEEITLSLTNGNVLNVTGVPVYETAWDGNSHLSESYMPLDGGKYAVNCFSHPVYQDGQVRCVLVGLYYSKLLTDRMNISAIRGENAYSFLLDQQGKTVIFPRQYENEDYLKLLQYINDTAEIHPASGEDRYFDYQGVRCYAHFEPIGINGWYLMTCAPAEDVFATADVITGGVFLGMGILWLLVLAATILTSVAMIRSRKKLRDGIYYDELLEVENGNALPIFYKHLSLEEAAKMYLAILDIDKFKEFNYLYGEACGDALLKYILLVLQRELPDDYLCRYWGDHFIILIHAADAKEVQKKLDKILGQFNKDIETEAIQPFDVSIGVRKIRSDAHLRTLISDAIIAKGTVKGIQVQQYAFFDESTRSKRALEMEMESDFARAMREGEFQVYYQPKYDMPSGNIIGAEALVRWVRKDGTIIMPGSFIPCFETSRQIIRLDEAVLRQTCIQMKAMEEEGIEVKRVSINLSRVHLRHHGILLKIEQALQETGVDPAKLAFEITESALYEDSIPLKNIVDRLHELGCEVDMDDYGIGMSGANALADNRFDSVKLDRSFVGGIGNPRYEEVIRSTISLAKALNMEILAEGVEDQEQADRLVSWGCTSAQGFYYSPPVPESEYRKLLKANTRTE